MFESAGLDLTRMNAAAQLLVGHYDFRNLSTAQLERQDTKRECYSATVEAINEHLGSVLNLCIRHEKN